MSDENSAGKDLTFNSVEGPYYALHMAYKTMKERCQQLQKRLIVVETENLSLRVKCRQDKLSLSNDDKSDVEQLQERIAQLTKEKSQLSHNMLMVSSENKHLWTRLYKLSDVNQSLGSHLSKINDTLDQHKLPESVPITTHLIRSKTFTQQAPTVKLKPKNSDDINNLSLEEISLKLIDSFIKEKSELEQQYAQMVELQNEETVNANSIGFTYPDEISDDEFTVDLNIHTEKLKYFQEELALQQNKLNSVVDVLKKIKTKDKSCKVCEERSKEKPTEDKTPVIKPAPKKEIQQSVDLQRTQSRMCPMCGRVFYIRFLEFQNHVESHFVNEDDSIVDNYEIITTLGT